MRLFLALPVPSDSLILLQRKFVADGIRLVHDFHCTVQFFGEIEHPSETVRRLQTLHFGRFSAHFSRLGVFPSEHSVRIIWVDLQPQRTILSLHKKIECAFDVSSHDTRFFPHVTLARVSFLKNTQQLLNTLSALPVPSHSFDVSELLLLRSTLTPHGPLYSIVERFPLS